MSCVEVLAVLLTGGIDRATGGCYSHYIARSIVNRTNRIITVSFKRLSYKLTNCSLFTEKKKENFY